MRAVLDPRDSNLFLPDLRDSVATLAWFGALNGLTIALLKGLSPGVPDHYQGDETIALSLVDPDNRRAVDYAHCRRLLEQAQRLDAQPQREETLRNWLANATDGEPWWALAYRCNPALDMEVLRHRDQGHGPRSLRNGGEDASVLFDATLKEPFPPISLPKREFMEGARKIWE